MSDELHDVVSAAFDQVESGGTSAPAAKPAAPAPEPADASQETPGTDVAPDSRSRDDKGRYAAGKKEDARVPTGPVRPEKPAIAPKNGVAGVQTPAVGQPGPEVKAHGEKPPLGEKPPQSWTPTAREHWAALPAEVRTEVARRERETNIAMQRATETHKAAAPIVEAMQPYMHMIRSEGGDPARTVQSLLQTAAQLRTAPPQAKADLVANLIRHYGVDVGMLDGALETALKGGAAPAAVPSQYRDPRFDQFIGTLQQRAEQASHAQREAFAAKVAEFAEANEFFEDLREDMADIIDAQERRGQAPDLQRAYERAAKLHPKVSEVLEQRAKVEAAKAGASGAAKSKAASTSVKSSPVGASPAKDKQDLRSVVEAAYDSVMTR